MGFRMVFAAFTSYVVLYGIQSGLTSSQAASLITIFNILSLIGRSAVGGVLKLKISLRNLTIVCFGVITGGFLLCGAAESVMPFVLSAGVIGISTGALVTLFPLHIAEYFDDSAFPVLYSASATISYMGSVIAPMLIFTLSQVLNGYSGAYVMIAGFGAICSIAPLLLPKQGK